jgi:hypothetical protein
MTYQHQRMFTKSDRNIYAAIGNSLAIAGTTRVELDKGAAHAQKFANRCAAAAVWNALETCDDQWDEYPDEVTNPQSIYLVAREIDDFAKHEPGTSLTAAAEAACRIIGHGLRWMSLPLDPQILAAWIATEKTGIAFGTQWTAADNSPGRARILRPSGAFSPAGHAVHLHGFDARHTYRPRWWSPARMTEAMFLVENSHQFPELTYYYPAGRVAAHALAAVVFIPPAY